MFARNVKIPEKIVLVDDVITSGETLLAVYHLLEGKDLYFTEYRHESSWQAWE